MPSDDKTRQILSGPGTSHWLKSAHTAALVLGGVICRKYQLALMS
jgi:hypothetical protein